ncbi:holin [Arthrobacter jiangjiafuii]|uniref:Holin n=1 Tax=Arthrobacter jiangjiafuii TaxID=2817475 RepID=A0A975R0J3_9MICC|nr:holin [Arthrobacter jiangjiafuii]MBP3044900.1 holin [Arthrobacter jiangjiafuii]QWC10277.1 holin [Arthrobacter jiangjiafuii]
MFTLAFWKATFERGIKTLAQSAAALLVGDGLGLLTVDWVTVGSVAGLAAVISVLTSIGTGAITDGSPSASTAETLSIPDGTGKRRT